MFVGQKPCTFGVKIRRAICVACGHCVDACSKGNFVKMDDGKPEVIDQYNCRGCFECYDGCISKAIVVYPLGFVSKRVNKTN